MLNKNGSILECNKQILNQLGYSVDSILNKSFFNFFRRREKVIAQKMLARAFSKGIGSSISFEIKILDAQQNHLYVTINSSTVRDETDSQLGVKAICIIDEITDRKELEQQLINYTLGLENEIDFKVSQMLQQESLALLGRLAGSIAHDINNPLQYVQGNCELLLEMINEQKISNEMMITGIERILKGCTRIKETTNRLRRISRTDTAKEFDIVETLKSAISMTRGKWEKVCVNIQTNMDEFQSIFVSGIENDIFHVFTNLIINSTQAIKDFGDISATLSVDKNQNKFICKITDNGIGIPSNIIEKIGTEVVTTKSFEEGTGLGLLGVFDIIKQHNGKIDVTSTIDSNHGTTFTVYLPLQEHTESS